MQWDYNAPEFGDLSVGDNFQKHSYPWGILVNATGRRFVDEGADFRNYTYAKYGAVVLRQPNNFAWQVFDGKIVPMLRDEYRIKRVSKVSANTLEEFAHKLEGVDPQGFLDEIKKYNAAVKKDVKFNPNIKDGRCTVGPRRSTSRTGPTPSRSRRSRPIRSAAACLHLRRRAHRSRHRPGDRQRHEPDPRASTPRANWSAASSTSTIPAAPA